MAALNALIDYLLLALAAQLAAVPLRRGRFALAAALGGAYAVGAAALPFLRAGSLKLAASLLLCLCAGGAGRALWRLWGAFLALSALMAGAVYALALLSGVGTPAGGVAAHVSLRVLALAFGPTWAAVRLGQELLDRREAKALLTVRLSLGGQTVTLRAARDTGNGLADPLGGERVLIADPRALAPLPGLAAAAGRTDDAAGLFRALSSQPGLAGRVRLLPYTAVGRASGLMVCFRPESASVEGAARRLLVGLSPTPICGGFDAIL